MSHLIDPDEWLTCPYDKSHRFPASRLQPHILKCKKSHPELAAAFVKCKYNATHLFLGSEIEAHENETCPDRHFFEKRDKPNTKQFEDYVKVKDQQENDWLDDDPNYKNTSTSIEKKIKVNICDSELENLSSEHNYKDWKKEENPDKNKNSICKKSEKDTLIIISDNIKSEKNDGEEFLDMKKRRTHREHSKDRETGTSSSKRKKRENSVDRDIPDIKRRIKNEPNEQHKDLNTKHHKRDRNDKEQKSYSHYKSRSRSRT